MASKKTETLHDIMRCLNVMAVRYPNNPCNIAAIVKCAQETNAASGLLATALEEILCAESVQDIDFDWVQQNITEAKQVLSITED